MLEEDAHGGFKLLKKKKSVCRGNELANITFYKGRSALHWHWKWPCEGNSYMTLIGPISHGIITTCLKKIEDGGFE